MSILSLSFHYQLEERWRTLDNTVAVYQPISSRMVLEEDIVNSGLEETMVTSYNEIREIQSKHNDKIDLRTAGLISAINKIAISYLEQGIFP